MLVDALQPERNLSHSPIFQVAFDVQTAPEMKAVLPGVELRALPTHNGTSMFDMLLSILVSEDRLAGSIEYSTDLFEAASIRRISQHFKQLLSSALNTPEKPITHLEMLTPQERQQILVDWNDTTHAFADDCCAHQLFEAWASANPEGTALIFNEEDINLSGIK